MCCLKQAVSCVFFEPQAIQDGDILLGIVDGMDRSKYCLPRWHHSRTPKGVEKLSRPSLDVYAVLLHGRSVNIYLTDQVQRVGASWSAEIWARSIQRVWESCQKKSAPFPTHAVLFGDNTPKELRNSCFHKFFSCLTAAGLFASTSLKHLPVGHTHEDVGPSPICFEFAINRDYHVCFLWTTYLAVAPRFNELRCAFWLADHYYQRFHCVVATCMHL